MRHTEPTGQYGGYGEYRSVRSDYLLKKTNRGDRYEAHYHILTMNQQSKLDTVDPKYQQTLIYGIQCMTTGEMYVGSTHETLEERIRKHIQQRGCRAVQILDRGNYIPYVIQKWPCNTLREVLTLEGGWQRAYKASFPEYLVNKQIEGQFMNETPEVKKAYDDQPWTCELCNRTMRQNNRTRHLLYYCQSNPEVQPVVRTDEDKKKAKAYDDQQWTCEWCGKTMRQNNRSRHKKKWCKLKPVVHEAEKGC